MGETNQDQPNWKGKYMLRSAVIGTDFIGCLPQ